MTKTLEESMKDQQEYFQRIGVKVDTFEENIKEADEVERTGNIGMLRKDGYESLADALEDAYIQATEGKGKERHAGDKDFRQQPIFWIEENFKSFQLGQAVKKIHESQGMNPERAIRELLGAINFIGAHVILLKEVQSRKENHV